jgi:hypothetical protein
MASGRPPSLRGSWPVLDSAVRFDILLALRNRRGVVIATERM